MTPREAYIALNLLEGIGPVKARALIEAAGSPQAVFGMSVEELQACRGIGRVLAESLADQAAGVDPVAEEERANKVGARILTPLDETYPEALAAIHDPPLALYIAGALERRDRHAVAVVGSRRCTHYGRSAADRLSYQMARSGFTVVSGLARGIDTAGHEGALKAGGRTLAVLGGALDQLYPPENRDLAVKIAENGAVISEFPLGRKPDRTTFPYRNRIVSGLVMGVLVVEAPPKSGALQTADMALEQGRTVFAVPGRIDTPSARGTNTLIKNGAKLVDDVEDILQEFEYLEKTVAPAPEGAGEAVPRPAFSPDEQKILEVLVDEEMDVDTLTRRSGLDSARVGALLIGLEMKRAVRLLPGRRIALAVGANTVSRTFTE